MQAVELRAGDVPVEAVGFQVQRLRVGQQRGQVLGDRLAILLGDNDGNGHVLLLLGDGCDGPTVAGRSPLVK
jgi:hypothetical protein